MQHLKGWPCLQESLLLAYGFYSPKSGSTAGPNVLFHGMGTEKQRDKEVMSQRQAMANQ